MKIHILASVLLLAACSVATNKWEDSAYRWQINARQPWGIAAGHVDSSTITYVPGDTEYFNSMKVAAQEGDPYAQWHLAIASEPYHGGEGTDEENRKLFADAYNTFKQIAENTKDPEALYMLANFYEDIERDTEKWSPVEKNLQTAFGYLMQAANAGFAPAQNEVGSAYYTGEGVEKNEEAGIEWQKKAALQGVADYQESLGAHYCSGFGCDKPMEAIKWYEMAAKQGHRQAQRRLAKMYADEKQLLIHDPAKALEWYEKCAMLGDDECLGEMWWAYKLGKGTILNPYKAYVWLLVDKAATTDEPYMYPYQKEEFENQLSSTRKEQAQAEAEQLLKTVQENKKGYPFFF